MNNSKYIFVAKLGKAVGLQGHLRLFIDSDFPEQFKKGAVFKTNKKLELKVAEYNSSRELIKFENFNDVDTAKKLTNQELFATLEQTKENCKLKKNEFFWFDLISCVVYENGIKLGKVKEIQRYPLNDYLKLTTEKLNSSDNSLGLLLNDKALYENLNSTADNASKLLIDLKQNPKRYVHFSVF
jgi:16S rRNA processing protein RimM